MPKAKRNTTKSPAAASKKADTVESPRGRRTRGSATSQSSQSPSPVKKVRQASPSPAKRTASRGRAGKATAKDKPSPGKKTTSAQQGQGDDGEETSGRKRVTRGVLHEAEASPRGKNSRKQAVEEAPVPTTSRSRSAAKEKQSTPSKAKAATPKKQTTPAKGGKQRSASKASPKETSRSRSQAKKSTAPETSRSRSKTKKSPAQTSSKETNQSKSQTKKSPAPTPTKATSRSRSKTKKSPAPKSPKEASRSRSRTKKSPAPNTSSCESDLPQLILTKIDSPNKAEKKENNDDMETGDQESPSKSKSEVSTPGSNKKPARRSRSLEKKSSETTPTRSRRGQKSLDVAEDEDAKESIEEAQEASEDGKNDNEEVQESSKDAMDEENVKEDTESEKEQKTANEDVDMKEEMVESEKMQNVDEEEKNNQVNNDAETEMEQEESATVAQEDVPSKSLEAVEPEAPPSESAEDRPMEEVTSGESAEGNAVVEGSSGETIEDKPIEEEASSESVEDKRVEEAASVETAEEAASNESEEDIPIEEAVVDETAQDKPVEAAASNISAEDNTLIVAEPCDPAAAEASQESSAEVLPQKSEEIYQDQMEDVVKQPESSVEEPVAEVTTEDTSEEPVEDLAEQPLEEKTPAESSMHQQPEEVKHIEEASFSLATTEENIINEDINQDSTGVTMQENGGTSPNRKRKLDDADDFDGDALPKKMQRSSEGDNSFSAKEVTENGTDVINNSAESDIPNSISMETEETATNAVQADITEQPGDIDKEYVVVAMEDIPAADSQEVLKSLPQVTQETQQAEKLESQVPDQQTGSNVLFTRKFIPNPAFSNTTGPEKHFSVVSYNILAQCHLERNDYSFTDSQYLSESYRHENLMREIASLDGDVVCMQEVAPLYFQSKLLPDMQRHGYQGLMKKRIDDFYDEGEATFYKTSRFTLTHSQTFSMKELCNQELESVSGDVKEAIKNYLDLPDVLVISKLQCNNTGAVVTVANVHINWGQMQIPDAQCIQIVCAIKELVKQAGCDSNPRILCGDFNSTVSSAGYRLATEGYLSDDILKQLQALENISLADGTKTVLVNHFWQAFQHTSDLKSAYYVATNAEPKVTSFNKVMLAAVDYIFYGGGLENTGVLEIASPDDITKTGGIPDEVFPSDHVSIKASFSFS